MEEYRVETEKGDKSLSLLFLSAARRMWKLITLFVAFCTIALTSNFGNLNYLDEENFSPFLRYAKTMNVALRPPELRPDASKWQSLTRDQMIRKHLHCDWEVERRIHSPDTWIGMREAYISVVGKDAATVELDSYKNFETAFQVPFEVRQSEGKGRGLFAMKDIRKGELLYDFSQSAQFKKGSEFAEFLRIIRPDLACDVLMWSYVQYFGDHPDSTSDDEYYGDLRIITDLDPGSFCNNGGKKYATMAWLNTDGKVASYNEHPTHPQITRKNGSVLHGTVKSAPFVATRDIKKGEELLCYYGGFSEGLNLMIE